MWFDEYFTWFRADNAIASDDDPIYTWSTINGYIHPDKAPAEYEGGTATVVFTEFPPTGWVGTCYNSCDDEG